MPGGSEQGDPTVGELFVRAAEGDGEAWNALVERLSPAIWATVRSYRLDAAAAEDLAQTVWLRLVDNLANINDPNRIAGWVQTTARREAASMKRRQSRTSPTLDDASVPEQVSTGPSPSDTAIDADEKRALLSGLDQLKDERCRTLLRLLAYKTPYRDISDLLGIAVGSIGATRQRCLDQLRATPAVRQMTAQSITKGHNRQ